MLPVDGRLVWEDYISRGNLKTLDEGGSEVRLSSQKRARNEAGETDAFKYCARYTPKFRPCDISYLMEKSFL